jgi:hypothetical protein
VKEGTKVKVLDCTSGHEFQIGEIVERRIGGHDDFDGVMGFYSETAGLWYMGTHEYKIIDKSYTIALLADAMNLAMSQGLSRGVWETIAHAIEQIEEDMED